MRRLQRQPPARGSRGAGRNHGRSAGNELRPGRPPHLIAILADDFTGACDAAAPFAAAGLASEVVLGPPAAWTDEVVVRAFDLDVRERSSADAHFLSKHAARRLRALQPTAQLLVKIDSTLRGPIGGLIAGALEGSQGSLAVVAPAFPEQGRFLTEGRLRLADGTPGPSLLEMFEFESAHVPADAARSTATLEAAIAVVRSDTPFIIVDADSPACLDSVAEAWPRHPEWLLSGSAGLSRRIAQRAAVSSAPAGVFADRAHDGEVLVVAGSPAAATHQQLCLLNDLDEVVVFTVGHADQRDEGVYAAALAERVMAYASATRPRALVLVGGQTGRLVCDRLDAHGVRVLGEVAPGVPIGRLIGGVWDGLPVITKAGGFGGRETLLDAVHALGVSSEQGT